MVKKATLTAILLFGIFFGAGNLIFPPALGLKAGEQLWPAIMGFIVSGVGLAVATLIVGTLNPNGYQAELTQKFNPTVSAAFLVLLYLTIGPFLPFRGRLRLLLKLRYDHWSTTTKVFY